jgi:hypothetical protein
MSQTQRRLAEEIIRRIETNRTAINGLEHGVLLFRVYRGQLAQMAATTTLNLSAGEVFCPLVLEDEPPA